MFNYVSVFMSVSLIANKGMLAFPAVKLLDIILARSVLELFGVVLATLFVIAIILSVDRVQCPAQLLMLFRCLRS